MGKLAAQSLSTNGGHFEGKIREVHKILCKPQFQKVVGAVKNKPCNGIENRRVEVNMSEGAVVGEQLQMI